MKWIVIIPDSVVGPIKTTFSDYYKAILFADPLAHVGARIYEIQVSGD